ncbi:putative RNA polymerase III transcription factor (TF)IIIC subunit [Trypanosoma vivax]|uniref:Transcription factor IIIC subunit 5 HTH domain-containing protein n=1 Tax=Trypanosoma vivax (strain Y486) TaxID=1055687 RepID=G0U593_TRYVY|nr:putative RNA polymerase III transcription factor (TF)IIIC subunit [Trypanosoma vivax]CCC51041.1 conserved hypothetical protein [Trypanosoma vivax Y486]
MPNVEPHRRYVSVELPFCLPVTTARATSPKGDNVTSLPQTDRDLLEAFIPPSFLRPCLDDTPREEYDKELKKNAPNKLSDVLSIASPSHYYSGEIFSGWRALDFATDDTHSKQETGGTVVTGLTRSVCEEGREQREEQRRESFPSLVPQVLLHGFWRNDVLVEVTRTRRIKRLRSRDTGQVVHESYVQLETRDAATRATAVGIVSREVNIVRPADFCFSSFTREEAAAAPERCSTNVFPPTHFLMEKTPLEVTCGFHHSDVFTELDAEGAQFWDCEGIPTLAVSAGDANIPPPMLEAQKELLQQLNVGCGDEECAEVQTVRALLEERPVWIASDLLAAIVQTGQCPRAHISKKVVSCLTYVIKNGPFNRLRIRHGFNPYGSHTAAGLQRIAAKISRRSELGTRLRDVSRVPHIMDVLREVVAMKEDEMKVTEGASFSTRVTPQSPYQPRGTFVQRLANFIAGGRLFVAVQIIDLIDDPFFSELIAKVTEGGPLPIERRANRNGWISESGYRQSLIYIADALTSLLRDHVEPALMTYGECPIAERKHNKQNEITDTDEEKENKTSDSESYASKSSPNTSTTTSESKED